MSLYFKTDELVSSTKFIRNFANYTDDLRKLKKKKIGLLRNNELDMVIIPKEVYEKVFGKNNNFYEESSHFMLEYINETPEDDIDWESYVIKK